MKWIRYASLPLLFLGLSACKDETKSMVWYKDHPTELVEVYKKCKTSAEDSDNCRNAFDASMRISGNSPQAKEISEFDRNFNKKG